MIGRSRWFPLALVLLACGSESDTQDGAAQASSGDAPCATPDQCPGADDVCQKRTCAAGKCGLEFTAQGTPIPTDSVGDCERRVCDGNGTTMAVPDPKDTKSDGEECTVDACEGGAPTNVPKPAGTACMQDGGRFCHADGTCHYCAEVGAGCEDMGPGEPNDTEDTAFDLGMLAASDDAGQSVCGVLHGAGDVDWYRYDGMDDGGSDPGRGFTSETAIRICKYVACAGMTTALVCPAGTTDDTSPAGHAGCCGTKPFQIPATPDLCPDGANDATVWIKIENKAAAACAPYQLDVHY